MHASLPPLSVWLLLPDSAGFLFTSCPCVLLLGCAALIDCVLQDFSSSFSVFLLSFLKMVELSDAEILCIFISAGSRTKTDGCMELNAAARS